MPLACISSPSPVEMVYQNRHILGRLFSILVGERGLKWTSTGAVVSFVLHLSNAFCSLSPDS